MQQEEFHIQLDIYEVNESHTYWEEEPFLNDILFLCFA